MMVIEEKSRVVEVMCEVCGKMIGEDEVFERGVRVGGLVCDCLMG